MPSLTTLAPSFRPLAERFFREVRRYAPDMVITSARRTYQEQAVLYQRYIQGRNDGLPAVRPGTSDHEAGLAFDMARLNVKPFADPVLAEWGKLWVMLGGRWSPRDPVHFAAPRTGRAGRRRVRRRRA